MPSPTATTTVPTLAGLARALPLDPPLRWINLTLTDKGRCEGRTEASDDPEGDAARHAMVHAAAPGWFRTLEGAVGLPLHSARLATHIRDEDPAELAVEPPPPPRGGQGGSAVAPLPPPRPTRSRPPAS